jgi:serine phosphatase RsbU (regulator of sigma subunit)
VFPLDETADVSAQLKQLRQLTREIDNFRDIAKYILPTPGEIPRLQGLDVFGGTLPLNGSIGGDHLIYVDFKQRFDLDARIALAREQHRADIVEQLERCRRKAGIALVDVSGHRMTDALLAAMLHQAFLLGAIYELDVFGRITRRLFENLNTRFYQSSGAHKFVSLIYGEIGEDSTFRFLSAAMPFPAVFSARENRFMEVGADLRISFPPLGLLPSWDVIDRNTTQSTLGFKDHYAMNKWLLMGDEDILLLHTDGLSEHARDGEDYFPSRLEAVVREHKRLPARDVFEAVKADILAFHPPADDISLVVIKRAAAAARATL